ncbi:helix-turn-helix domain-containing protein [Aeromonas veronii]|uniref:helix-turn-helix domain-containing protein n=1 Tax=Aeromonas veronii TaxID=654 RepID=UPI001E4AF106|nr:helix-turn-helix domain-containing protein [Aeromonas veronii]MCD6619229.1 helix-turn-helix domain-containing protein [Aeromonas veronii]
MAKTPTSKTTTPAVVHTTSLSSDETNMLRPDNVSVVVKNGTRTVTGFNHQGEKVVIKTQLSNPSDASTGFRSKSMSVCSSLPIDERQSIAKQLYAEGLTQAEIAEHLGVSQKTISNDLK